MPPDLVCHISDLMNEVFLKVANNLYNFRKSHLALNFHSNL